MKKNNGVLFKTPTPLVWRSQAHCVCRHEEAAEILFPVLRRHRLLNYSGADLIYLDFDGFIGGVEPEGKDGRDGR